LKSAIDRLSARKGDQIVGVGAIKPVREQYAAKVARNSEVDFPANTQELGLCRRG
jgi:hypothetical protein